MIEILCPVCNRVNDAASERCWYCQALLPKKPIIEPGDPDALPGEENLPHQVDPSEGNSSENLIIDEKTGKEIPEWLARIRMREQLEREQAAMEEAAQELANQAGDSPDWSKPASTDGGQPTIETGKNGGVLNTPLPDSVPSESEADSWLRGLLGESLKPVDNSSSILDADNNDDLMHLQQPDRSAEELDALLKEIGISNHQLEEAPASPQDIIQADLPSKQVPMEPSALETTIEEDKFLEKSETPPSINVEGDEQFEGATELEPNGISPDITDHLHEEDLIPEEEILFELSEEDNEWLAGLHNKVAGSGEPGEGLADSVDSVIGEDDLPEWLSSHTAIGPQEEGSEPELSPEAIESLKKAQLPAWLQAIRPVESVAQMPVEQPFRDTPTQGVLAGITGALQSPDLSEQAPAPRKYSTGLSASELQRKNAMVFKNLLESEPIHDKEAVPQKSKSILDSIIRGLVSLAILMSVLLPFFSSTQVGLMPVLYPSEVVKTFSIVQQLPTNKPVLVIGNFEAALAGELKWVTQPIFSHIVGRNIPVAVMSTNVIGSAVLVDDFKQAGVVIANDLSTDRLINLGFLPGGSLGLTALVANLHDALPFTSDLRTAWDKPLLVGVNGITDFGGVIVVTDNAEIVRSWVEQVKPNLGSVPLVVLVSAQAGPMIQPYFDSSQVDGYISGMNGSLSYEQIQLNAGNSYRNFGSFQTTLLLVAVIVFLGGVASLIQNLAGGQKQAGGIR